MTHRLRLAVLPGRFAVCRLEAGTELAVSLGREHRMPALVVITKCDRENADPGAALDALRATFGDKMAPLHVALSPAMQQLTAPEIDWLGLFGERGDDLLTAIAIAAGKPRAWVNELAADEALLLAAQVIEVNADFFTRTVIPKLDGLLTPIKVPALEPASGSTPSST